MLSYEEKEFDYIINKYVYTYIMHARGLYGGLFLFL